MGGYFPENTFYALITNSDWESDYANGNENIIIKNIKFVASLKKGWPDWEAGSRFIVLKNVQNVVIERCYFEFFNSGGEFFIMSDKTNEHLKSKYITIRDCKFIHNFSARGLSVGDAVCKVVAEHVCVENCYLDGAFDATNTDNYAQIGYNFAGGAVISGELRECYAKRCVAGVWFETAGSRNFRIIGGTFEDGRDCGIGISASDTEPTPANVQIISPRIKNIENYGIEVGGVSDVDIIAPQIEGCKVGIGLRAVGKCSIVGGSVSSCPYRGIHLGGSECVVEAMRIETNEIDSLGGGIVIAESTYYNVTYGGKQNIIRGCLINSAINAVKEDSGADYNQIIGNRILGGNIVQVGANTKIKHNMGYTTENSGTQTFDGDGTITDFLIGDHGLVITDPSKIVVKVTPISSDAIDASPCIGYVDPNDNTKIRVKFDSAPPSGSENVKITWEAMVIG